VGGLGFGVQGLGLTRFQRWQQIDSSWELLPTLPDLDRMWVWGFGFRGLGLRLGVLGFGFWVLGFGVWGLGFGVCVLGFGFWGLGFGFRGLGFGFWVLGFWVLGCGFWVLGLRRGVWGLGSRIHSLRCVVSYRMPVKTFCLTRFPCSSARNTDAAKPKRCHQCCQCRFVR